MVNIRWVSDLVPAIAAYRDAAAPENACVAEAGWTYAWLVAPIFSLVLIYIAYIEPIDDDRTAKQRGWGLVLCILLLLVAWWADYYGLYDPYPGTGIKGRWEEFYRRSELGVIVITIVAWWGLYSIFGACVLLITEITGIKRIR